MIEPNEWFVPIIERYPALEVEYRRLEPLAGLLTGSEDKETERINALCLKWRSIVDDVRTILINHNGNIYVPKLAYSSISSTS